MDFPPFASINAIHRYFLDGSPFGVSDSVSRSPGQVAHQQGAKSQGNLQQHHIDLRCKGGMSYPF